jgi:2,5-diamino-6-(ribosylamino)-4(3H)-pyrimidinone 5'-phosphate reductase
MKRPYVICHMVPSVDGRIVTGRWNLGKKGLAAYERVAETFDADAWIIGRISMEPYAGKARVPRRKGRGRIARTDFVAPHDSESYAIAIDPSGKLRWSKADIDGEHVIAVLTEGVSDDYLAFLQEQGVSYVFGGRTKIDLARVLPKLGKSFGIETLLLEGGGTINGSFLEADLIDELSILVAPVADGSIGTPSLFDAKKDRGPARRLELFGIRKEENDLVWLRYKVKHERRAGVRRRGR